MKRRDFLKLSLASTAVIAGATPLRAEDRPKEIRIGTQKGGFFPAVRARGTIENAFKADGINVVWVDFQFGPPRSEEHTSELQSRLQLVCRLLLEKKNKRSLSSIYFAIRPDIFY